MFRLGTNAGEFLATVPGFCELTDAERLALNVSLSRATYAKGTVLFDIGDQADSLYVVMEGEVHLFRRAFDSTVVGSGGIIGLTGAFNGAGLRVARAKVFSTMATLLRIPFQNIRPFKATLLSAFMEVMADNPS